MWTGTHLSTHVKKMKTYRKGGEGNLEKEEKKNLRGLGISLCFGVE
jgi:hypothetical protein